MRSVLADITFELCVYPFKKIVGPSSDSTVLERTGTILPHLVNRLESELEVDSSKQVISKHRQIVDAS